MTLLTTELRSVAGGNFPITPEMIALFRWLADPEGEMKKITNPSSHQHG